jgi:hypothetical protein
LLSVTVTKRTLQVGDKEHWDSTNVRLVVIGFVPSLKTKQIVAEDRLAILRGCETPIRVVERDTCEEEYRNTLRHDKKYTYLNTT